jgi:hypothetical protein
MVEDLGSGPGMEPAPGLPEGARRGAQHHLAPLRSRLAIALIALAIFGSGGYLAWIALAHDDTPQPAGLGPGEIHRIRLDGPPQPTAAGEGAAWTAVGTSENDDLLWRIDAVTEKLKVLPNTRGAGWPAVGEGFAWVTCTGKDNPCRGPSVLKLDPRSGETLAAISLPSWPFGITTGLGAVWVSMHQGLARVDPVEERVTAVFEGNYGKAATAGGAVWTTSDDPDRVYRIDPTSGTELDSLDLDSPCALETSEDIVWVETCYETSTGEVGQELTKIDAHTAEVVFRAPLANYGQMQVVGESLWTASLPDRRSDVIQVVRLDPESGEVATEPIRIATGKPRFTSHGPWSPHVFFAADGRSLWLADFGAGDVIRLGLPSVAHPAPSSGPTVPPTAPGVAMPGGGTGLQTIPEILEMDAEVRGDSIVVTNRNDFDWSDCNVQIDTRLNELDPFEHPIVALVRSGESVILAIDGFEKHAMTTERLSLETFQRHPWKRLILVCQRAEGSASGRVEWGPGPGPPDGPGAVIGVAYPFDLYTHCGVRSARFDGRDWNADPPLLDEYGANPPPGWGNPFDRGTMTLIGPNLAEFRSDAGHVARFRPRLAGEPDLAEGCA